MLLGPIADECDILIQIQTSSLYSDGANSVSNGYKVHHNILPPGSLISLVPLPDCHIMGIEWIQGCDQRRNWSGERGVRWRINIVAEYSIGGYGEGGGWGDGGRIAWLIFREILLTLGIPDVENERNYQRKELRHATEGRSTRSRFKIERIHVEYQL